MPGKKLKKVFVILGTTAGVYAGFQYLLPLVAPFLLGYGAALFLRPSARFLSHRLKITYNGKCRHLPVERSFCCWGLLFSSVTGGLGKFFRKRDFWEPSCLCG